MNTLTEPEEKPVSGITSLRELLNIISGKDIETNFSGEDGGISEHLPYPFLAIVDQYDVKLALLLSLVNPLIGGVLLAGPRGTGKTTAVRSLLDLLPDVERSTCFYGCMPEDIESGGLEAVCPECAAKYGRGESLTRKEKVRLVELPLNATLDDVVGSFMVADMPTNRPQLKRGILSHADLNILYIDEINLLDPVIINAILDAASYGSYIVRRGPLSANYKSRFSLIGSMNPEEGILRPQIMDRFGLRVLVTGLKSTSDRNEAYQRVMAYKKNPRRFIEQFSLETQKISEEIQQAKIWIDDVTIPDQIARIGSNIIQKLQIDSIRAEITLFETAKAYAALCQRNTVTKDDLTAVAHLALRWRNSKVMNQFSFEAEKQDEVIREITQSA